MKKFNLILRKCKSFSRELVRSSSSSSYRNLKSKSVTEKPSPVNEDGENGETVYVGSSRRRYVINPRYLTHPLINALISKAKKTSPDDGVLIIGCEVVIFEHLLWMLENADLNLNSDSNLDELVDLYVS